MLSLKDVENMIFDSLREYSNASYVIGEYGVGDVIDIYKLMSIINTYYDIDIDRFNLEKFLEKSEYFEKNGPSDYKIKGEPLLHKLRNKWDITIDYVSSFIENVNDFMFEHFIGTTAIIFALVVGTSTVLATIDSHNRDKYVNSIMTIDSNEYNMSDIYVAYTANELHLCNRRLSEIEEGKTINGSFRRGNGSVYEQYYREEIFDYYDIKSGEKICSDHEDGYFVESLLSFYNKKEMKEKDYQIAYDEVLKDLSIDDVISRDPSPRRVM